MAGIAGGTGHQLLPSEHSCPGVCPGVHRTGQSRAGRTRLGQCRADPAGERPSLQALWPRGSSLLEVGGAGLCLAHTGLHPDRGLDRASTFTGLRAEETQMCL